METTEQLIETVWSVHDPDKNLYVAQAALARLRQRVEDLEAFYQHMVEYHHDSDALARYQQMPPTEKRNQEWQAFGDLLERLTSTQEANDVPS